MAPLKMENFIEEKLSILRSKSKRYKRRFSLAAAFLITLAIFFVWYFTFHFSQPAPQPAEKAPVVASPAETVADSSSQAWDSLAGGLSDLMDSFSGANTAASSSESASI